MSPLPRPPASRLEQLLRARQFVITAELTPPVSCDADDLLRKALPLRGLADAVNVTDGASARAHLSAPIAAAMLAREGIEPILQLTCRDRNRIALQADLMGAAACGVTTCCCLTGDDPKAGDQPETKAVFDVDSTHADAPWRATCATKASFRPDARWRAARVLPRRRRRADRPAARLAAGQARGQDRRRRRSSRRPSSAWMPAIVRRYAARLAEHAATRGFFLLIGIAPLRSAKSARWMKQHLLRDHHPRRIRRAAGAGRRSRSGGRSASPSN